MTCGLEFSKAKICYLREVTHPLLCTYLHRKFEKCFGKSLFFAAPRLDDEYNIPDFPIK